MKMKKMLALLLAVLMVGTLFAACGGGDDSAPGTVIEEVAEKSDDDLIKEAINGYATGILSLDADKAKAYIAEGSEAYNSLAENLPTSLDEAVNDMIGQMGVTDEVAAEIKPIIEDFFNEAVGSIEIDVTNVEVDGDKATADVTLKSPDFESLGNIDFESLFTEEELADIAAQAEGMTETEFMVELFRTVFDKVDISDLEVIESSAVLDLEKQDGAWLIVADN